MSLTSDGRPLTGVEAAFDRIFTLLLVPAPATVLEAEVERFSLGRPAIVVAAGLMTDGGRGLAKRPQSEG